MAKDWNYPHIKEKPVGKYRIARFREDGSLFGYRCKKCEHFWKIYQSPCSCSLPAQKPSKEIQ